MSGALISRREARWQRAMPWLAGAAVVAAVGAVVAWRALSSDQEALPLDVRPNPVQVTRVRPRAEAGPLPDPASLARPTALPVVLPMPATTPLRAAPIQSESGPLVTTYESDMPRREVAESRPAAIAAEGQRRGGVDFKPFSMQGAESGAVTDLSNTIKPTTRAICTLDQAIDSQHEGRLVCHLANAVLSWDNSSVMLPKGTPVLGSYQGLSVGQGRLMAIAASAIRSDGVIVPLGAPFTDDMGRMGVPGYVDTRFWERFGNAIIMDAALALIGLPQAALTSRQPGTTNLNFNAGSSEGVISEVLRSSVNLPPVMRKNPGEDIAILITQPIRVNPVNLQVSR